MSVERELPTSLEQRRLQNLFIRRTKILGELAEVELEIQRVQMGQPPHDIIPPQADRFWRSGQIDFNQTRAEQANQQSDAKQMHVPYEHLIQ